MENNVIRAGWKAGEKRFSKNHLSKLAMNGKRVKQLEEDEDPSRLFVLKCNNGGTIKM